MGIWPIAAFGLAFALAPGSAWGAASPAASGDLSARLAELAKPSVRSAPPAQQAKALSLAAEGPGSLLRDGNRVLVEVRFDREAAAGVDDLRAAGAEVVNVSRRYQTVTAAAKPGELRSLRGVPDVTNVSPVLAPIVAASECPAGIAVSQGDAQLHAAEARASAEVDGSGVTVGILSDSFDKAMEAADESGPIETHEADDVESGDLPGAENPCGETANVNVLDDPDSQGEDEGRAMAQIVHDLAPGANLAFATAFISETVFAENVELLAESVGEGGAGANVIADDVTYPTEPFFQEGVVGNAVRKVTEAGVSYFSSAANNNLRAGGKDIASWEAPLYRDSSGCPAAIVAYSAQLENAAEPGLNPTHCMDFSPGTSVDRTFRLTVFPGSTLRLDLQWAEPWEGVATDLDAFLLGPKGELVARSIEDNVADSEQPFEFVGWKNNTGTQANVKLVINNFTGANDPRLKFILLQNGGGVTSTEYETSQGGDVVGPTIFGHNGAEDATSVAAINQAATVSPEPYSSRGPVTHYFGPVNGLTAAEQLEPEAILSKPDLTATDCNVTTFFAEFVGTWRFCGTSAAAPHSAGVAALMLQKEPLATPQQIRAAMQESATSVGTFGPCAVGAGLVEAVGAIAALLPPGSGSPPACTPPESGPIVNEGEPEQPPIVEGGGQVTPVEMPPPEVTPPPPPPPNPVPQTRFVKHPKKVIRTAGRFATAIFRFGASESGVTFICRIDEGPFHRCEPRLERRFARGFHVVRVFARNAAGSVDLTPAAFRFRVERIE